MAKDSKPAADAADTAPKASRKIDRSPGADRLRAFEDAHFGKDAVRIDGKIERGSGSPFAAMSDEDRARYEKLERLVAAEQAASDAHMAAAAADTALDAAQQDAADA